MNDYLVISFWNLVAQVQLTKPTTLPSASLDSGTFQNMLKFAFLVLGGISLLIVTLQGFRYASSSGDPSKTAQARNGIIYAVIGVVIAVNGYTILEFVLDKAIPAVSTDEASIAGAGSLLTRVTALVALLTGITSIFMLIYGGFKYVKSSGDPSEIASAKRTITYALIGSAVAAVGGPIFIYLINRIVG